MADSDIVLGIDFDISNVKRTAQEIQKELNNGLKSGGGESPALKAIEAQIDNLSQKVSELADAMKNITGSNGVGASTEAIEGLDATVQSLIDTLVNLAEAPAVNPVDVDAVDEATDEMVDTVTDGAEQATEVTGTMLSTFLGSFLGSLLSHFVVEVVKSAIRLVMNRIKQFIQETRQLVDDICNFTVKLVKDTATAVGKLITRLLKSYLRLGTSIIKLAINGIRALIAKLMSLKSVVMENLQLMAKWRKGNNEVNKALSNLTSSIAYLKGALASVVAPILISIEPMLTRIIDKLAEMVSIIGMLIAKLTGASTFQKAIRKQKDFAKALNATAGAASKTLAPFDELNVLAEKNGDAVDWATVTLEDFELPDWLSDLYELGTTVGLKVRDFLRNIPWDSVKEGAEKAAKGIKAFINGILSVRDLGTEIGHAFGELVNTITTFLNELLTGETFYKFGEQAGDAFIEGLRTLDVYAIGSVFSNALNAVVDMIIGFFSDNGRGKSSGAKGKELGNAIAEFIATALGGIEWTDINVAINLFVTNLVEAFKALLTPETFSTIATTFTQLINSIFFGADTFTHQMGTKGFNELGNNIATGINTGISKASTGSWGSTISDLATGLLNMLKSALDNINTEELTAKVVEFLSSIDWEGLGGKISEISDKLMEAFEQIWQELKDSGTLDRIVDFIAEVLSNKETWERAFKSIKRTLFWEVLFAQLKVDFEHDWKEIEDWFKDVGKNIVQGILSGISGVKIDSSSLTIVGLFQSILNAIKSAFGISSPAETMKPIGENIVLGILEGFGLVDFLTEVQTWWNTNVAPWFIAIQENVDLLTTSIGLKMTAFKDSIIDTFRAIKNGIKIPINYIIAFIEGMVNKIIFGLNWLIDGLSKVKFDVPDNPVLFGALSGTSFGINIGKLEPITIPRLATGGVIPPSMSEHLAMLGDNNAETEVVSPLSTMKEAMLEALTEAGVNGQPINIYLGTKLIYSEIKKLEKRDVVMGG